MISLYVVYSIIFIEFCCLSPCKLLDAKRRLGMKSKLKVSRNKRRYKKDGFNLDLTYITGRCIAMSLPSTGIESFYRNSISEVSRFFNEKYINCYKIYNLCHERKYDSAYFNGNVVRYDILDHNVPEIKLMYEFCKDATLYLKEDIRRVIGVHCKGGKGRTGTMICAYLLYSGICEKAENALYLFKSQRTDGRGEDQGVTGASQKRFVYYFELLLLDLFNIYDLFKTPEDITSIDADEFEDLVNNKYGREVVLDKIVLKNVLINNYYSFLA